ncbi:MAG: polysaccharide deacetylase family protein [Desulfobacterales bacterium]|nr:polysaccharide deacetylase family protein [Desulfobacterales bacterium]
MKTIPSGRHSLSLAEQVGLIALPAAGLLSFFDVRLPLLVLAGFIILCFAAPFFPRFGFYLPIISRGSPDKKAVALTFDDGPDPLSTPHLLALLGKHRVKATFFVTGQKAAEHPGLIKEILLQGHTVGNHSYTHNNLVMFRSCKSIVREIESAQKVLSDFGVLALAFRPPVGITGPRLWPALIKSDRYIVNFSCRAFDGGNRWIKGLSRKILHRIGPGDIVLLHDVRPHQPFLLGHWLQETELILSGIKNKGLAVWPLDEIIDRPVMMTQIDGIKKSVMKKELR